MISRSPASLRLRVQAHAPGLLRYLCRPQTRLKQRRCVGDYLCCDYLCQHHGSRATTGNYLGHFCQALFNSHRHAVCPEAFSLRSFGCWGGGTVMQQLPLCFLISCSYIIYLVMQHDAPIKLPLRHAGRKDQCLTPLGHDDLLRNTHAPTIITASCNLFGLLI